LKTPREVRNAIVYVLQNALRHGVELDGIDPFSSGATFDGWKESFDIDDAGPSRRARTWRLSTGWRRHGLISIRERPAARPR
jgi:hypothetical protein